MSSKIAKQNTTSTLNINDTDTALNTEIYMIPVFHNPTYSAPIAKQITSPTRTAPWRRKYYYLDPQFSNPANWTEEFRISFEKHPLQVRGIFRTMAKFCTGPENSKQGAEIIQLAKTHNFLKSKIENNKLFAYYRSELETLGIIHNTTFAAE